MLKERKGTMQENRLELEDGCLRWREERGRVTVLGMEGKLRRLTVPEEIEGCPVTEIGKKAFFNCGSLRFLSLPDTLEEVGSWAFAHCARLERVRMPWKELRLGQDLFLGSGRLAEIRLEREQPAGTAEIAALLAAAATRMDDPHLFSIAEAGSAEWLKKWDARMLVILREPDAVGFERNVLTGEEDYASTDFNRFTNEKRRAKARLAFLRLLNPYGMPEEIRLELEDFLRSHTKGCSTEEAWEVLLLEHTEELPYYSLFARLGCVTADNFDAILQDMKEDHPEMKAYLMRYKEENLGYTDFFDSLSLDLF